MNALVQSKAAGYTRGMKPHATIPYTALPAMSDAERIAAAEAFRDHVGKRRTCRMFTDAPVPRAVIAAAIEAAGTAPSGANHQPWHFAAISSPEVKHRIRLAAEEEEAAKSPVTERVHLATGLLLPVWKRLPGDHVRVTRLVTEDGQSIIGREVLDIDLAAIAETFGLSGVTGPSAEQIGDLVLASGKPLCLASHDPLTVKRSLVGGEQRLELTGFSPDRLDWYKGKGCFTEIIRYRTRLFVAASRASEILGKLGV